MAATLTAARLRDVLEYDPLSGLFRWRVTSSNRAVAGTIAGTTCPRGYIYIRVDGKRQCAHRLAWLYMKGAWPAYQVDHEDLNKSNNRWLNLRSASDSQNKANRPAFKSNKATGLKGVIRDRRKKKNPYYARIMAAGVFYHLGAFPTAELAHAAYAAAANKHFGEFARAA